MYTAEEGYYTNLPRSLVFSYALRCPRRAAPEKPPHGRCQEPLFL